LTVSTVCIITSITAHRIELSDTSDIVCPDLHNYSYSIFIVPQVWFAKLSGVNMGRYADVALTNIR